MDQLFENAPLLLHPRDGQGSAFERIQDAQEVLALSENDLRSAIDPPIFLFFVLYQVRTSHVWMLPIPTGSITEWNEFSAGLLLKAHKIGAAFCWVWLRLNWIMFWAWGRVKIQAMALCPKCNALG
jgi:hypothetical protein